MVQEVNKCQSSSNTGLDFQALPRSPAVPPQMVSLRTPRAELELGSEQHLPACHAPGRALKHLLGIALWVYTAHHYYDE